jgi:protein-tyrosine-phosphatase
MSLRLNRRSVLLAAVAAALAPGAAASAPHLPPRILFVCQFGTVKSPIARELLKRRAAERGLAIKVAARGITPQRHMTPELLARLKRDGINPSAEPLQKLRASDISSADLVIAFDRLPADFRPRHFEDWSDLPSVVNDYDQARPILDGRIDQLLRSLPRR